jgi:hypothetical protein
MAEPAGDFEHTVDAGPRRAPHDRVTLAVLIVILMATAAGLFGDGPVSHRRTQTPSGVVGLTYDRFGRFGAALRVTIDIQTTGSPTSVVIADDYLSGVRIDGIVPRPEAVRATSGGVEYLFAHAPGTPLTIHLEVQSIRRGVINGALAAGGERLTWWHFIYP